MRFGLRIWFDCIGFEIERGNRSFIVDIWPFNWEWERYNLGNGRFVWAIGPLHVSLT